MVVIITTSIYICLCLSNRLKMSKNCIYIFKHNIYVRIAIYMSLNAAYTSKLQYIRPQFTKYMSKSMYGVSFYIASF